MKIEVEILVIAPPDGIEDGKTTQVRLSFNACN